MPSSSYSTDATRIAAALLVSSLAATCQRTSEAPATEETAPPVTIRQEDHMSTYVTISVAAPESRRVLAAIDAAYAEIARAERLLSEWKEGSEISAVNRAAGQHPVKVGEELFEAVRVAHEVSVASEGAFDITVGALWGIWDFKSLKPVLPDPKRLRERLPLIDYRRVVFDAEAHSIQLTKPDMLIGLGGIAKGYAVDRASAVLKEHGYANHLIVAGGDLYASGTKYDRKWKIGVRHPRVAGIYATVEVKDEGVATSGDYQRHFVKDGQRYHHIIDPKTGFPARGTSSSTVIAPNATLADAWATALFVLGPEKGLALAKSRPELEALLLDAELKAVSSPNMGSRLQVLSGQTAPAPDL